MGFPEGSRKCRSLAPPLSASLCVSLLFLFGRLLGAVAEVPVAVASRKEPAVLWLPVAEALLGRRLGDAAGGRAMLLVRRR